MQELDSITQEAIALIELTAEAKVHQQIKLDNLIEQQQLLKEKQELLDEQIETTRQKLAKMHESFTRAIVNLLRIGKCP